MRRAAFIFLAVIGALLAMFLGAWIGVFHTPPGREFLEEIVERELGGALDSSADIGALKGSPPSYIVLDDVMLSDAQGPWLTAERLELRWRPLALLKKRIVIDEAQLSGVTLLRMPPEDESPQDEARQVKTISLPNIDIRRFVIDDFIATVGGAERRIDGEGAVRLNGPDIAVLLDITSEDGADLIDVDLEKSPRTGAFRLAADVKGAPGGALAALLGLESPLALRASGDGPVSGATVALDGSIGAYGDISAEFIANLSQFDGAAITLDLVPGTRLDTITELSGPVSFDGRYDARRRGGSLTIRKLTSSLGDVEGALSWRAPRGFIARLNIDIRAQLAEDYRIEVQKIAGASLALKAQLDWRSDDYALQGTLTGPLATLTLENGATDLRRVVSGDATLMAEPRENADFWIEDGFTLEAALDADFESQLAVNGARLETGLGARFAGTGAYGLEDDALTLKGDFVLPPAYIAKLSPGANVAGNITGDIDLSGPLERFTLQTAFETPALTINDSALPPMSVEAALAGLPGRPTGDVAARAADGGQRRLDAQLRSSEDGTIRIPSLAYSGRGFALDGSGRIEPNRQTVNLDLTYQGDKDAEPWPGVKASGDLAIKGVLSRDAALSKMEASAETLRVNDIALQGFAATAEGPPGALEIEVRSDGIETPQTGPIADLSARGQVDARGAPKLMLSAFEAVVRDNEARLTEPARFTFDNGVAVENLRLAWGAEGAVALDGAFSETRWRADAVLTDFNIPDADGQITANIALDTDAKTPAKGGFRLRSLLLKEEEPGIDGRFIWDGKTVRLTDSGEDAALDMDLRLPAVLVKTPKISVDTSGAVSGRVRYDGDIQAIAAYMPPVLQTIEGDLAADFALSGTLAAPSLEGEANLTNGAYTEIESGFSIAGLHAEARAAYGGDASSLAFKGGARGADQSREDAITFNGDLTFGEDSRLDLAVKLDRAELSAHPVNQVRADGELTLAGPLDALKAEGTISIVELNAEIDAPETTGLVGIDVIAVNDRGEAPETQAPPRQSTLDYDIHVEADDRIFIRGRGLESEWAANVNAVAGREAPLILGSLSLRRGWLDFSGRRFNLTRGAVDFDRNAPNDPRLDIRAELSNADVTAAIVVSGRASEPTIELTSTPSLPSEDVMALVLFGKPAQELTPFESLQTAEALASLSGIGPFGGEGVTGRLRRTVGLDLLNVDLDPETGGSLTVGKYVTKGIFVSASQDAQGRNGSVTVKYEVTDNIVIETELEQDGDQTVSANWKKDF